MMDKLKMQTANKADDNFRALAALFPNAVTETIDEVTGEVVRAIDKDVLMQEISCRVVEGREERYQFTWPDKKKSVLLANAPTSNTLRPCREDSVDFDHTENLYIEGDNLEVLKLLHETYLGKIKMVYIDPPYNTGNDFVYEDEFAQSTDEYLANSGQFDEEGNRLVTNTESSGRFHTDWLNMIYPRLKLAKDLLTVDGVIFISIDDSEQMNLSKLCDEVFGETNRIGVFAWISKSGGGSDNGLVVNDQEYVLCYAKKVSRDTSPVSRIEIASEPLDKEDAWGKYRVGRELNKWGANSRREDRPTMYFPIKGPNGEDVYPIRNDGTEGCWRWGKPAMFAAVENHNCEFVQREDGTYIVYEKIRSEEDRSKPYRTFIKDVGFTSDGSKKVKELFEDTKVFDFPKPLELMRVLIQIGTTSPDDYVLDFFSGSATTAHAVMQLNAEDGGHRKFIMVQLAEETDEKSEAYKAGYKNICEIGKERIRRAGTKIKEDPRPRHWLPCVEAGQLQHEGRILRPG
jgi:adenine-specific DNA-methyltransferase